MSTATNDTRYVIASLKHTHKGHEHITFWGPDRCGYVLVVKEGHIGTYLESEFGGTLNNGESCLAVPIEAVIPLLSPRPYQSINGKARPFYDIAGEVVDNTRENWDRLIAAAAPWPVMNTPKPEVYRGKRHSFSIAEAVKQVQT